MTAPYRYRHRRHLTAAVVVQAGRLSVGSDAHRCHLWHADTVFQAA
ncbi:hypothetical protein [Dactylosporangium sp. CA-139066]